MAAVTQRRPVVVRGALPGEGPAIAELWRELWDAHEGWGGYPGSRDPRAYIELGARLDQDASARRGQPILGRHIHVIATVSGGLAGQVEGWVERHGVREETPMTCEVRSLIVTKWARGEGVGSALLLGLADAAGRVSRGIPLVLGAEVLERNPAHGFYARLGYRPVSYSLAIPADDTAFVSAASAAPSSGRYAARLGEPRDALAIAVLDAALAERRRADGDPRFDPPRAVDAAAVDAIANQLREAERHRGSGAGLELVSTDSQGHVRATATFVETPLDPPFLAGHRAVLGRFALDPAESPALLIPPLIALGRRLAARARARFVELTDLTPPGTPLYEAAVAAGAAPWSRIVTLRV
jgi:GNAT superfamily N-acetyltransferase